MVSVTAPEDVKVFFEELVRRAYEDFEPDIEPDVIMVPVDKPLKSNVLLDAKKKKLALKLVPEQLRWTGFDKTVINMIKYGLIRLQFKELTPMDKLEDRLTGNDDLMKLVNETVADMEKNQEYAIHYEEDRAFRYIGKIFYNVAKNIQEKIGVKPYNDYIFLGGLRGINENLSRAVADFPGYSAEYILDIFEKSKPLGMDLGRGNEHIEYLKEQLKEKHWQEYVYAWKDTWKEFFRKFPSYIPDE